MSEHHEVVIVGGGSAGVTVAARLARKKVRDIVIVEPSATHAYQPLWTLVGGGLVKAADTIRPTASVIPRGVEWIRDAATSIDPATNSVTLEGGGTLTYDWLVVAAGLQLDWSAVPGLTETLGDNGVSSNYTAEMADYTWRNVSALRSGTAVFSMPAGPIKCGGAPQKAAYLSCDHWRRAGVLNDIEVHLVLPTPKMFGIPEFSDVLDEVVRRYGIHVHFTNEVVAVDGPARRVTVRDNSSGATSEIAFDMAHVVPPQSAPTWLRHTPLADPASPQGYVKVDKFTLRHPDWPNVFALGDCAGSPNSKTGAAVRKQAPVVVANLLALRAARPATAEYHGYSSCPIVTSSKTCVIAEFDYDLHTTPSFPVIRMAKERRDMYLLKRYGLPQLYWRFMLKGRA